MNDFLAYVSQFGPLTQPQQDAIAHQASRVTLRKGDYFIAPGTGAQRRVGFVEAGVLRIFSATEAGEDITRYFVEERHPLLDVPDAEGEEGISCCSMQAVTECQLVVFTAQQWQAFAQFIPGWEGIAHQISVHALREKMVRIVPLVTQDAAARYRTFLAQYPQLANRVPLAYLASYLGMTPSSLSRVRKQIR